MQVSICRKWAENCSFDDLGIQKEGYHPHLVRPHSQLTQEPDALEMSSVPRQRQHGASFDYLDCKPNRLAKIDGRPNFAVLLYLSQDRRSYQPSDLFQAHEAPVFRRNLLPEAGLPFIEEQIQIPYALLSVFTALELDIRAATLRTSDMTRSA